MVMLEGEWAYLNRPDRLSFLVERFFSQLMLMPMSAENFAEINAIKIKVPSELNHTENHLILDKAKVKEREHR